MKTKEDFAKQGSYMQRPKSASVTALTSRDKYKNICKKAKIPMNAAILERYFKNSLINDEIEVCFDEITSDQLPSLPRMLKMIRLAGIKLWSSGYEQSEFAKLGLRRGRAVKDQRLNSSVPALLSKQFASISEHVEKSHSLVEIGVYGLNLSAKTWTRLGLGLEKSCVSKVSFQQCCISEKEFEAVFQHIGAMEKLTVLDLSSNKLKNVCGYLLGRIISKQGERRDTCKWEGGLRGSIAEESVGLLEIYVKDNEIGDSGWEKIMSSLVSDNWLRLIDAKNNGLSSLSFASTREALEHNNSVLVMDLRENGDLENGFIKILEVLEENFNYVKRESETHERYAELFECICNEEELPQSCGIRAVLKAKQKKGVKNSHMGSADRKKSPYLSKISQQCDVLREENERLRKKLGKGKRKPRHKLESTQDYIALAQKKLEEANEVLELADDF
jgi:hypothetical protein